jgi:hypothetical protein
LSIALTAMASPARAQTCPASPPDCSTLTNTPLYVLTADTQENALKGLGHQLNKASASLQFRIIYKNSSSCTNVATIYGGQMISGSLNYIPDDPNWDEKTPCTCNQATPVAPDVASAAIFTESCGLSATAGIGKFRGPSQAYEFSVRKGSTQTAITADEGYFVLGFGAAGMASPWLSDTAIFIRPADASTLIALSDAVGVPPAKAKGVVETRSADMLAAMSAATAPDEATIGLLGSGSLDKNRTAVLPLAFKAAGQYFAYYADSTRTTFDKINMRQGRYFPWSVTDWLTKVDGNGNPTNTNAAYLINLLLDQPATPTPAFDPLPVVMAAGLVPACAMQVSRASEAGPLAPYDSPTPCGCAFDAKFATTTCSACTDSSTCNGGMCRHGYCEKK